MMNHNRNNGHGTTAQNLPLFQSVPQAQLAKELINYTPEEMQSFLNRFHFRSVNHAYAFALCLEKCKKYKLYDKMEFFINCALAETAVNGARAGLFARTAIGLAMEGDEGLNRNKSHDYPSNNRPTGGNNQS